jgi:hypothetical protein
MSYLERLVGFASLYPSCYSQFAKVIKGVAQFRAMTHRQLQTDSRRSMTAHRRQDATEAV